MIKSVFVDCLGKQNKLPGLEFSQDRSLLRSVLNIDVGLSCFCRPSE